MTALEQSAQFEEIQTAYRHHRALIDASPTAIVDFDVEGRVRSWNKGATEMFGWTEEEAIGRVSPIVPEGELEYFLGNIARIAGGETMRDLDLRRRTQGGLNKGEARNALARAIFFCRLGPSCATAPSRGRPTAPRA